MSFFSPKTTEFNIWGPWIAPLNFTLIKQLLPIKFQFLGQQISLQSSCNGQAETEVLLGTALRAEHVTTSLPTSSWFSGKKCHIKPKSTKILSDWFRLNAAQYHSLRSGDESVLFQSGFSWLVTPFSQEQRNFCETFTCSSWKIILSRLSCMLSF